MAALKKAVEGYEKLRAEWKAGNLAACGTLLQSLKLTLTELKFMPTSASGIPSEQELLVAREVLEVGAQWSVKMGDVAAFERYMAQLKTYYFDFVGRLPSSSYKQELLGLSLLCLLSQNRIAEFHTELERLDVDELQSNVYLRHPIAIEQYLMEGAYNKVYLAKESIPAESYSFFMDILVETIHDAIASGLEKSYESLSPTAVAALLFMTQRPASEVATYAEGRGWSLDSAGEYTFNVESATTNGVNAAEMIKRQLQYAQDLEQIV